MRPRMSRRAASNSCIITPSSRKTRSVMEHLVLVGFLIGLAFAFARVEIEIEGPNGWAANLPTWRVSNRWTKLFYGNRPLTGYHFWLQVFVFLMAHLPFALDFAPWSWSGE